MKLSNSLYSFCFRLQVIQLYAEIRKVEEDGDDTGMRWGHTQYLVDLTLRTNNIDGIKITIQVCNSRTT